MRALEAADIGSVKADRLWQVLTFFDRMLFCPRPGGRTVRRGGSKHRCSEPENESGWSATLGDRIRLFVAGEWAELWRETLRVSYVVQESRPSLESAEKRRVQRVDALREEGELARAAAVALPSCDPLRSDDVLEKLRDLFPHRPDGDHASAKSGARLERRGARAHSCRGSEGPPHVTASLWPWSFRLPLRALDDDPRLR